jgi:ethanolamine utilization protein EutQ (cupin superfamily)
MVSNDEEFIGGVFSIMLFDKGKITQFGVIGSVHTLYIVVVE